MLAVILSGGSGTRLWPLSREAYPKQFLPVVSDDSLLAETIDRGLGIRNRIIDALQGVIRHRDFICRPGATITPLQGGLHQLGCHDVLVGGGRHLCEFTGAGPFG